RPSRFSAATHAFGGALSFFFEARFAGAAAAGFFATVRLRASRSFFFTCALRRFIFIELRRSNRPMVGSFASFEGDPQCRFAACCASRGVFPSICLASVRRVQFTGGRAQ